MANVRNMYMSEDYNSPQSVYWSLKSLIVIILAEDDPFWVESESPYPNIRSGPERAGKEEGGHASVAVVEPPRQIICNALEGAHHFLLSPGQFVGWPIKASQAKYCKFAYSSAFGFSVPTGQLIQQIAPDNMLLLSRDGAETWAGKWKCSQAKFSSASLRIATSTTQTIPIATVNWCPWGDQSVKVTTTLIPPTANWPDWHVRVHRIKTESFFQGQSLHTAEGGFAVSRVSSRPNCLLTTHGSEDISLFDAVVGQTEGIFTSPADTLVLAPAGATGIRGQVVPSQGSTKVRNTTGHCALIPDSNTNIMAQRTIMPIVTHDISGLMSNSEVVCISYVFAISAIAAKAKGFDRSGVLRERWSDMPHIQIGDSNTVESGCDSIILLPN